MSEKRRPTELERAVMHADAAWSNGECVDEYIVNLLDEAGFTSTVSFEEHCDGCPEELERAELYDWKTVSSWTEAGNAEIKRIDAAVIAGTLEYNGDW